MAVKTQSVLNALTDKSNLKTIKNSLAGLPNSPTNLMLGMNGNSVYNRYGYDGFITQAWTYLSVRYIKDSLFKRVCEIFPKKAIFGTYVFDGIETREDAMKFAAYMDRNAVLRNLYLALVYAEVFGGGALVVDGRRNALMPLDKDELVREGMDIDIWAINRWQTVGNINTDDKIRLYNSEKYIDISRLVIFKGDEAPHPYNKSLMGWGLSKGEHVFDAINKYYANFNIPFEYLAEAKIDVIKLNDLAGTLLQDKKEVVDARLEMLEYTEGKKAKIILDQADDYQTKTYSFGGLSEMMAKSLEALTLELGIPRTVLLGEQNSGFSNKDTSADTFLSDIEDYRAYHKAEILKLFKICYMDCFKKEPPANFNFEFPVLANKTDIDLAKIAETILKLKEAGENELADKIRERYSNEI